MDIVRNLLLYDDDNAGCNLWLRGCVRCNPFRGCAILAVSVRDMDDPISPVYKSGQDMSRSGSRMFSSGWFEIFGPYIPNVLFGSHVWFEFRHFFE